MQLSASSSLPNFPASNAADGNDGTFYSSQLHSTDTAAEWLQVDLGSQMPGLSAVTLTGRPDGLGFPQDFSIESSRDGIAWQMVPGATRKAFPNPGGVAVTIPFDSVVSARYIRIDATKLSVDNEDNYYFQLSEVSVKQKYFSASASSESAGFPAMNLIDGQTTDFYASAPHVSASATEWVQVDLGAPVGGIDQVRLYPRASGYGFPSSYSIETSMDGATFTSAPGATISNAANPGSSMVTVPFESGVTARYVRLVATALSADDSGTYYLQLAEIGVDANSASGAGITPSSVSASSAIFPATNIIDNNPGSFWTSNGHDNAQSTEYFTLNYSQPYTFTRLTLTPRDDGSGFPSSFVIQYSMDGINFATIPGQTYTNYLSTGTAPHIFTFDPTEAVALRVVATVLRTDSYGVTYFFQLAEAQASLEWDTYSDTWVGTDALGRVLPTESATGEPVAGRTVGIMYEPWHTDAGTQGYGPNDVSQILASDPSAMSDPSSPPWGPSFGAAGGGMHYWSEPIYGYYTDQDTYVIAKDAELLQDAGVDVIVIDLSNFQPNNGKPVNYYLSDWMKLLEVWQAIRDNGGQTPQVMFLTPWDAANSAAAVTQLYHDLYGQDLYSDLWFAWEGKPLVMGQADDISDQTITSFFTYRGNQPGYNGGSVNQWGWLSNYPQPVYASSSNPNEEMTVSAAQNSDSRVANSNYTSMTWRDAQGNYVARGRSYQKGAEPLSTDPVSSSYPSDYGYNFAEQWSRVLEDGPSFVFIDAWNEWIAGRFSSFATGQGMDSGPVAFVDDFTPEFSRDLEPVASAAPGSFSDDFYNELVYYIRLYKGTRTQAPVSGVTTINMNGSFDDWAGVTPEYRDTVGDVVQRNSAGFGDVGTYTDNTGRNDISVAKVARDSSYVYFYVQTAATLTPYTDPNWMRLFICTDSSQPNWVGYNYALNVASPTSSTHATLSRSTGGWAWAVVDPNITYQVSGNMMEVAIPRADLGLGNVNNPMQFTFKWADNISPNSDASEFYLHGDSAPDARFSFSFSEQPN